MTDKQYDWLKRLLEGMRVITRFPSGQWSRGGNKFGRANDVGVLHGMGWIERVSVSNAGRERYGISPDGAVALKREAERRGEVL